MTAKKDPPRDSFTSFAPTTPPAVGAYWLGGHDHGFGFHLMERPSWFHRLMVRLVLGWIWKDA